MQNSSIYEKLKVSIIILFNFSILIIIEKFLTLNSYSNSLRSPVYLIRYLPVFILLYYLINEISLLFDKKEVQNRITREKDGIIFVPELFIWIAIFETYDLSRIQKTELNQLLYLDIFSLEIDYRKLRLRVFLYGDSFEELRLRIVKNKPILDIVLPSLVPLSPNESQKFFENEKFENINNFYYLRNKKKLSILSFEGISEKISSSRSKITFCFYPAIKDKKGKQNGKNPLRSQWYSFYDFDQYNPFKNLSKILKLKQSNFFPNMGKKKTPLRIKIRFRIEDREDKPFVHGISNFEKHLSSLLSKTRQIVKINDMETKKETHRNSESSFNFVRDSTEPSSLKEINITNINVPSKTTKMINTPIKHALHNFTADLVNKNQICIELCNIQKNSDLLRDKKVEKCIRRATFCQKMLKNNNFLALLENIMNQAHEEEKIHLTAELQRHLSNQQIICIFTHLCQFESIDIPIQNIVDLIHLLFKLKLETHDNNKEGDNLSIVTKNNNEGRFSPSLMSN
ncbi:MAG: hypothetical protein ACW97X_00535 [Candidatus Hodarchaeales archaeon]